MSLLINGTLASRVGRSAGPTTQISAAFVNTHLVGKAARSPFALTLQTAGRDSLTVILACDISQHLAFDIVLAIDWKAHLRELLLSLGDNVPAAFDPWATFLPSTTCTSIVYL
ncbi:hypothetical protein R3P38DRAFT_2932803 [Favolaschia claudopus]|uniref:Uncharacterized protein n=1 Tax=Favolaschia claudopus TaxID=2862362 RepID=A0AAW0BT97_9AGAR